MHYYATPALTFNYHGCLPAKYLRRPTDLLSHGPDANIVGGNLNNRRQEEIQVHIATKSRSTE